MKLTKASISNLRTPPDNGERFDWDDALPGFGVRARRGKLTYVAQYRVRGQTRRKTIGDVRKVELEAARKAARQLFAEAALGRDVVAERRAEVRAASAPTLGTVADAYCSAKQSVWRAASAKVAEMYFRLQWAPLRNMPIDAVPRARIAARLHEIAQESGAISARQARTHLRALFNWAAREGLCEANPAAFTNDPAQGVKSRERTLTDAELRAIWHACQDDFGKIVRLLMLTGCRRAEIGGLRWSETNLQTGVMTIPAARTKNCRKLELPLPAVALDILRAIQPRPDRDCLFGGESGFGSWGYAMRTLNQRLAAAGNPIENWGLHDVRRTVRTGLGQLGVRPDVAERVIGHARGGVEATYDRHSYQPQIKAALALWADHLLNIVENRATATTNVVQLTGY